jgi:hypothetical protein
MDVGSYLLLSGTRLANGSVLAHLEFFNVKAGQNTKTRLILRKSSDAVSVIGNMDVESLYRPAGGGAEQSLLSATGRGYFLLGILGAKQEPTNHALNDMARVAEGFEHWGRRIVLLFPDERGLKLFDAKEFPGLPHTICYGVDVHHIADAIAANLHLPKAGSLPIFVIADSFGRIVYVSQGYTIDIGEQMLGVIHKL